MRVKKESQILYYCVSYSFEEHSVRNLFRKSTAKCLSSHDVQSARQIDACVACWQGIKSAPVEEKPKPAAKAVVDDDGW